MECVKPMVTLLSCISNGKKDQIARCDIEDDGMLFAYHSKGKSLQIKTTLPRELFDSFQYFGEREKFLSFALNLSSILDILSIFGANSVSTTSVQISHRENESILNFVLQNDGVICECGMQILEHDRNDIDHFHFESAFENSSVMGRCIMMSQPLHDAFAELYDMPSAATVFVCMHSGSERAQSLSLRAESESGSCEIDFAATSSAFVEFSYLSNNTECSASFHVAVLQQALKALNHSIETFIRMNANGFLSVQHMIQVGSSEKAFIDVLLCPEDASIR